MAPFKKTSKKIRINPVGLPDFSGYANAAKAYASMSDTGFALGATMREQKVNELILEAEAAGRTAGSTYDKDNNLVPLTNLDLNDAIESQVFGESEKQALRSAYKQAALKTYAATVSLDAKTIATTAYDNAPNDPDAVRGALDGYLDSLGVEDEVLQYVMPNIIAQFQAKESQANSNLILQQREVKKDVNIANINDLAERLGVVMAKGPGTDPDSQAGHSKMVQEIQEDIKGSYEALETIGFSKNDIEGLQKGVNQVVATKIQEAHIERVYLEANEKDGSGLSAALREIEALSEAFAGDPEINADVVAKEMSDHLQYLVDVRNAQTQEGNKRRTDLYGQMSLGIAQGKITTVQEILSADLDDGQKFSLMQIFSGRNSQLQSISEGINSQFNKVNKEKFSILMATIKNPTQFSQIAVNDAIAEAGSMIDQGLVPGADMSSFFAEMTKMGNAVLTDLSDVSMAKIELMMSPTQGYGPDPAVFQGMTEELVKRGIVGTRPGAAKTRQQWQNMIDSYASAREIFQQKGKELLIARAAVKNRTASSTQVKLVQDMFEDTLVADADGNVFFHQDLEIREQNFDRAVGFALSYGTLPTRLAESLGDLKSSAEAGKEEFQVKIQIYNKILDSLIRGTTGSGVTDFAMPEIMALKTMKASGIDTYDYEIARIFGHKLYRDTSAAQGSDSISINRSLKNMNEVFPNLRASIEENFMEALGKDGSAFLINNFVPFMTTANAREQQTIRKLRGGYQNAPGFFANLAFGDGVEGAYIGDERVIRAIEALVIQQYATKNNLISQGPKGLQIAIREAVMQISEDGQGNALLGLSVDSNNEPYWTFYPWYMAAKESIGDAESVATGDKSVADMVYGDIKDKFLSGKYALGDTQRRLLQGNGVIFLEPNSLTKDHQTYMVKVLDPETEMVHTIASDYRYNFLTSRDFPAYVMAIDTMKNSTIASALASIPFMKPTVLNSLKANIDEQWENHKDPGVFNSLIQSINESLPEVYIDIGFGSPVQTIEGSDMAVLKAFMDGTITPPVAGDAASMDRTVEQILQVRMEYEKEYGDE